MKEKDLLDSLFEKARNEQPQISLEQTVGSFEKSIAHSSMSSLSKFFTIKNIVIMITTSIIASSIIYLALPSEKESIAVSSKTKEEAKITVEEKPKMKIVVEEDTIFFSEKATIETVERLALRPLKSEFNTNYPEIKKSRFPNKQKKYKTQDVKRYPVLTEEEIRENNKHKKRMLKNVAKRKGYAYIPSGEFTHENSGQKFASIQGFYIQQNEVTNLEYRTFLFDLLIQGRKGGFDIAKPDQEEWVNYFPNWDFYKPMQENYFSHSAYDEYPVVNVTPSGIRLYCEWLTKEVSKAHKINFNPIRIPMQVEWIRAASAIGQHQTFPWSANPDSIQNEKGCYLANFKQDKSDIIGNYDGAATTAKTATYLPNNFALYNMAGNVAELCIDSKTGKYFALGGSWFDTIENLKLFTKGKPFIGPKGNPTVGFRVVWTHVSN